HRPGLNTLRSGCGTRVHLSCTQCFLRIPAMTRAATTRTTPSNPRYAMTLPRLSCLALAVAALAIPAASRSATNAIPQLYIDVATHDMAGMPAMGGLGRMAMG